MPDLEQRLAAWRQTLAADAAFSVEVIDELESHLRDDIQRLVLAGESEERALELGLARLGPPRALGAEFAKVARERSARWLPVYLAHGLMIALAASLIVYFSFGKGARGQQASLLLASHVIAVTIGYSATFVIGGLAVCYVVARSFRPLKAEQARALTRAVVILAGIALASTLIGVFLGGIWARDRLGRFWAWDPKETGAALVLAWDAAMILVWWRRPTAIHAALLLAFVGNIVVTAAWFGPNLIDVGLHSYGSPAPTVITLTVFVLSQQPPCPGIGTGGRLAAQRERKASGRRKLTWSSDLSGRKSRCVFSDHSPNHFLLHGSSHICSSISLNSR